MNKKDLIPIILLVLLIPAWMIIDRVFIAPKFPAKTPATAVQPAPEPVETGSIDTAALTEAPAKKEAGSLPAETEIEQQPRAKPVFAYLQNEKVKLELTSLGGGITTATLIAKDKNGEPLYPELNEKDSPPVVLDFSGSAALAYEGIEGIGAYEPLNVMQENGNRSVSFSQRLGTDVDFERTITLSDDYLVSVSDRFINTGSEPWALPEHRILTGQMENPADTKSMKGISILGVDSYTPDGMINYWGRKLHKLYGKAKPLSIDTVPVDMNGVVVDWVSAKNKFFTQILRPEEPVSTLSILSSREPEGKGVVPADVTAALNFKPQVIDAGTAYSRNYSYFIGPKKYSILKETGNNMEKVMEFETIGFWSFLNWLMEPARKFLLVILNFFYGIVGNYGVAIILLTLLIRILFWPLTHKGTESMGRMQELQPQIKAIQAKYKNKKDQVSMKKMQSETMALYKENKVNPMGGCLPMFVQIPVFIALFTVLRNAIELRYSGFLWIADLSTSENLFAGQIPFVGSLNILPIVMSLSMIWQQKLSSPGAAATPEQQQQQKMMMFMMPIMMLFFFYTMPSGLVLYWTTSNLLMIAQTGLRNLRKKKAHA